MKNKGAAPRFAARLPWCSASHGFVSESERWYSVLWVGFGWSGSTLCLKKRPTFTTCYNFYIHSSIATIFGINIAEKVGNQNILHFPTTPN